MDKKKIKNKITCFARNNKIDYLECLIGNHTIIIKPIHKNKCIYLEFKKEKFITCMYKTDKDCLNLLKIIYKSYNIKYNESDIDKAIHKAIKHDKKYAVRKQTVDNMSDEITSLESQIQSLININSSIKNENESLKDKISDSDQLIEMCAEISIKYDELEDSYKKIELENEQLKNYIKNRPIYITEEDGENILEMWKTSTARQIAEKYPMYTIPQISRYCRKHSTFRKKIYNKKGDK